ncbi:hypothetical protein [Hyphobacterium sp.]|uniref:hypothetical protein n=1 Tax=Hyphobacterium sp. TaxID=2004662 RepID=UPI0037494E1C
MIRLAVICLPLLAMACASVPEAAMPMEGLAAESSDGQSSVTGESSSSEDDRIIISSGPHLPFFPERPPIRGICSELGGYSQAAFWIHELPIGLTQMQAVATFADENGQSYDTPCTFTAHANRQRNPFEYWLYCETEVGEPNGYFTFIPETNTLTQWSDTAVMDCVQIPDYDLQARDQNP